MANPWFRLWGDMINDPKWRTIARASKQNIGDVVSVYVHMMTCASNATERGRTDGWCDEDVATALDIETEQVEAIRNAMQGRVLDGDYLTGWEKRQPLREDGAAERAKAWREEQKASKQTTQNATERNQTLEEIREEEKRLDKKEPKAEKQRATRLPADWHMREEDAAFCIQTRPELSALETAARFRDYWHGISGSKGCKLDWPATWRNWVRNEKSHPRAGPTGYESAKDKSRRETNEALTGRSHEQRTPDFIDIN